MRLTRVSSLVALWTTYSGVVTLPQSCSQAAMWSSFQSSSERWKAAKGPSSEKKSSVWTAVPSGRRTMVCRANSAPSGASRISRLRGRSRSERTSEKPPSAVPTEMAEISRRVRKTSVRASRSLRRSAAVWVGEKRSREARSTTFWAGA